VQRAGGGGGQQEEEDDDDDKEDEDEEGADQGMELYARVLLAVQPRGDSRTHLKVFKRIPRPMLESILPSTRVQLDTSDQVILGLTLASGAAIPLLRSAQFAVENPMMAEAALGSFAVLLVLRVYWSYWSKRTTHQLALMQNLYFKNMASNSAVIALLLDRATEQQLKNALLAYYFAACEGAKHDAPQLQARVDRWLASQLGSELGEPLRVRGGVRGGGTDGGTGGFDAVAALSLLEQFGLLLPPVGGGAGGKVSVVPIADALAAIQAVTDTRVANADAALLGAHFRF